MAEFYKNLKQTSGGIYYWDEYVPVRKQRYYDNEKRGFAQMMWDYKESPDDDEAFLFMTAKMICMIQKLSKQISADKIGLVAVPPSKVGKYSPVKKSIEYICQMGKSGKLLSNFGIRHKILDYSTLLTRTMNIPTKHETGERLSTQEEMATISCCASELSRLHLVFIIFDDITTSGSSLNVCRNVLLEHGAVGKYIIRAAIGKTI